ncbi:hypothetical protein Back11_10140 [Paenibacillus baekrokdamisoli]|uniref:Uncharacterized protein n=1 Tax=Paenibacillus baekrokdamisoli TaxID=1712516 RepID=A0A3G9J9M9_9BACL|nr:hypothetical protein [Paenibacillus baekrokdamisoli]MBB3067138.1 hypothetical protein [Paenibacillus baekrokdamisoli]BBH19669.1 hypothetical protein Back11_10140 [Paenibacillus baekrokdamisoli]
MRMKLIAMLAIAFCLLLPTAAGAKAHDDGTSQQRQIQVFDVNAGKVIKTAPNSKEYQDYAKSWLGSVSGLSPKVGVNDKCGYVFRIPLDQPAAVKAGTVTVQTSDLFLFYCPGKAQLLLIFDENRKPYLLEFKADIKPFLKSLDIK